MPQPLLTVDGAFREGQIRDRPNRFVLEVELDDGHDVDAYISNTGSWNVTKAGRDVLVRPVDDESRKTDYDAVFVRADDVWVSVDASFANTAFRAALDQSLLPPFKGYEHRRSEPPLPGGGRADFELLGPSGESALVEVKSCTLVEDGIAKFPDRPTKRGRRHVRELIDLQEDGTESHVVFVVQRSDGTRFTPNRAVDPDLADLVAEATAGGVGVHAMQLSIDPPTVSLESGGLQVDLDTI